MQHSSHVHSYFVNLSEDQSGNLRTRRIGAIASLSESLEFSGVFFTGCLPGGGTLKAPLLSQNCQRLFYRQKRRLGGQPFYVLDERERRLEKKLKFSLSREGVSDYTPRRKGESYRDTSREGLGRRKMPAET